MAGEPVGSGGGEGVPRAATQAASPPAPPVPATAYELGVSLAIPTETLDAVLRQAGGSRETSVEYMSNIPEMLFSCACWITHAWEERMRTWDK